MKPGQKPNPSSNQLCGKKSFISFKIFDEDLGPGTHQTLEMDILVFKFIDETVELFWNHCNPIPFISGNVVIFEWMWVKKKSNIHGLRTKTRLPRKGIEIS